MIGSVLPMLTTDLTDSPRRLPSGTKSQGSLGSIKDDSLIGGNLRFSFGILDFSFMTGGMISWTVREIQSNKELTVPTLLVLLWSCGVLPCVLPWYHRRLSATEMSLVFFFEKKLRATRTRARYTTVQKTFFS